MKKFSLFLGTILLAVLLLFGNSRNANAQFSGVLNALSGQANSEPAGTTQGKSAGVALRNLYTQYKADGKIDTKNLSNILNMLQLVNSCSELKNNKSDKTYMKDFTQGLLLGSSNLVTTNNSTSVINSLTNLASTVDTSSLTAAATAIQTGTSQTTETVNSVATAANSVTNLVKLFK